MNKQAEHLKTILSFCFISHKYAITDALQNYDLENSAKFTGKRVYQTLLTLTQVFS